MYLDTYTAHNRYFNNGYRYSFAHSCVLEQSGNLEKIQEFRKLESCQLRCFGKLKSET